MTKFDELVTHISHPHVYIQTHNFPDPDAISSAFGLQMLLRSRGIDSTLCYSGKIDRHNTLRLLELSGVQFCNLDKMYAIQSNDEIILVDAQKGNSNIVDMTGDEIICIDHHPINSMSQAAASEYLFSDIRPEVGACASIIAAYFFENDIPIDTTTATLLSYAIKVDTNGLSRGMSQLDMDMYYRLFEYCDMEILRKLDHSSLQFDDLQSFAAAINSIAVYDDCCFANSGYNCPEGLIAKISDFVLELQEVSFAVVYAFRESGVKLSIRSEKSSYDAGKIAAIALEGIGSGGGHPAMAGGYVRYADINQDENVDEANVVSIIQERFIKALSVY